MGLKLYVIAAACENMGIGAKGDLQWNLKKEMAFFTKMTSAVQHTSNGKTNAVLMGRRTWDSIPEKFRPLKNRINIVLTRREFNGPQNVLSYNDWNEAMEDLQKPHHLNSIEKIWVIGGSDNYKAAIHSPFCHRIYLTRILKEFECDTFFPNIDDDYKFKLVKDESVPEDEQEDNGIKYVHQVYEKVNVGNFQM